MGKGKEHRKYYIEEEKDYARKEIDYGEKGEGLGQLERGSEQELGRELGGVRRIMETLILSDLNKKWAPFLANLGSKNALKF